MQGGTAMKKTAHCIHHTHWDLIWYFTAQDATVQLCYNIKEMLEGFRNGRITDFFYDGQSAPIDEYLKLHPEDRDYIQSLVEEKKLIIGPFQSQLDCFICNGESIINNLRLGIQSAEKLGNISKVAYLPDSFGHSWDFPKIFNQYGIKDFVITRGVGDDYDLGSEFYMKSNDDSELLVCTMIAGYGYGCYAFRNGTLFDESALDYNKISVQSLIKRLLSYSTLDHEFVFPLGFDQNPAMLDIPERIEAYNQAQNDIEFVSTTWQDFCNRVRMHGQNLKCHEHELFSTQYHRVHRSIFSARADIKALQDCCEREITYGLQPLMSMLDAKGIPYDHGLIDSIWDKLLRCQTHSSATLTDETNDYIQQETQNAYNLITSTIVYLLKLMSISIQYTEDGYPLIVCNTLPYTRSQCFHTRVQTKKQNFRIIHDGKELAYTMLKSEKKNYGVLRKDIRNMDPDGYYYDSEILLQVDDMKGFSYRTLYIQDIDKSAASNSISRVSYIENNRFRIHKDEEGIHIFDFRSGKEHRKAVYLEESGDEGDSFDYSPPNHDWVLTDTLENADIFCIQNRNYSCMTLKGSMEVPGSLKSRKNKRKDSYIKYEIHLELKDQDKIHISGTIDNHAIDHRVRLVFSTEAMHTYSLAGTQYSYIKRESNPESLKNWKKDGWFEEPSPTWPLLNHVSVEDDEVMTVMTRSCKEYELIGEGKKDLAIVLYRSYGAMGYPDLNRRPGRPSGLDYMIFQTPKCQMLKENRFDLSLTWYDSYDGNKICKDYIEYASPQICFEGQHFDKSVYPISYFPTNPLEHKLPESWSFLDIEELNGCFGSLVKEKEHWLLRVYNNEIHTVSCGLLHSNDQLTLSLTTLDHTIQRSLTNKLEPLRKGELRMIQIQKK